MKLPFDWLCEYVDLSGIPPQEVAQKLTMGAFEVEEITTFGPDIEGPVVVGEILDIQPIPNADKIRLTKVRVAEIEAPLDIICGANNIEVGQFIPVALPGSKVINRHDGSPLPIISTIKRGVASNGMLCSSSELGLPTQDVDGIYIFPNKGKHKLGADIKKILHLHKDHVLHVGSRSNRGDALSVRGLAREVAALCERPLIEPKWILPSLTTDKLPEYKISIDDQSDCEFFSVRPIGSIHIEPAPVFIVQRLAAIGVRSINNIVDITNYVMHEYGQPFHAYDASLIKGETFKIRRARASEAIKTIDAKERALTQEVLVVADIENAVCVAGIMGSLASEVGESTRNIALEAASFIPTRVRRASRILGLHSEASLRFERGVDMNIIPSASDRAAYLISEYCKGHEPVAIGPFYCAGRNKKEPLPISLRREQVKRHLGVDLEPSHMAKLLKPLGFEAKDGMSQSEVTLLVPSFRQNDVSREIDIVEEVARIYGFDRIEECMPQNSFAPDIPDNTCSLIRATLSGQGMNEAYISSLVPNEHQNQEAEAKQDNQFRFITQDPKRSVGVLNPLSQDHQVLRQSLLPGLMKALIYNRDRGEKDVWLYETARVYRKPLDERPQDAVIEESMMLGGILTGNPQLSRWQTARKKSTESSNNGNSSPNIEPSISTDLDFFTVKGILENLLESLKISCKQVSFVRPETNPSLTHPAKTAELIYQASQSKDKREAPPEKITLGFLGEVHPGYSHSLQFDGIAYFFELNIDNLRKVKGQSQFSEVPSTPMVSRDLTVDFSSAVDNAQIVSCLYNSGGRNLQNVELVSIFSLDEKTKSFSYRITFQHPEKTLTNESIEKQLEQIRKSLTNQLHGTFRA